MNPASSRILFIHGNCHELLAAAIILNRIGPHVYMAANLDEAQEKMEQGLFDLVVLEEPRAGFSSREVFQGLPQEILHSSLIVTNPDPKRRRGVVQEKYAWALDVLEKPVSPIKLVATICEYLIELYENQNEIFPQEIIN